MLVTMCPHRETHCIRLHQQKKTYNAWNMKIPTHRHKQRLRPYTSKLKDKHKITKKSHRQPKQRHNQRVRDPPRPH